MILVDLQFCIARPAGIVDVPASSYLSQFPVSDRIPTHDSTAPLFPAPAAAELSSDVPIRRTVRAFRGLREQAEGHARLRGIHVQVGRWNIRPLSGDAARRARIELVQPAVADAADDSGAAVAIGRSLGGGRRSSRRRRLMSQRTRWETPRERYDEHNSKFSLSMKPKFNRLVGERNHF
jgi:hypothetical protein